MFSKLLPGSKTNSQELTLPKDISKPVDHLDKLDVKSLTFDIDQESYIGSEIKKNGSYQSFRNSWFYNFLFSAWNVTLGRIGGDWIFLAFLGITMAWISLLMEYLIKICVSTRIYMYMNLLHNPILQYFGWICLPVCLIVFSTGFTKIVAPQAAGSGIPEMKTMLRGVVLKESFTFKALIAKIIGLSATLGTGLPLGKEGPYVHIASIVAILLSKASTSFRGIYENKTRHAEMLAAACAVGVATAYSAPIGGLLFSIEVTAVHFAVRNYWRGFFAAVIATVMHGLIAVWFQKKSTLTALYRTNFTEDSPYSPQELVIFAIMGIVCGFLGALFVWFHRLYSKFKANNAVMKAIVNKSFLLYPFLVTLFYTSLTFPLGLGMFVAGDKSTDKQINDLFSNYSFQLESPSIKQYNVIDDWTSPYSGIFINLATYVVFTFFGTILASTIPVPAGIFVPVFKIGCALGRIFGETMVALYPYGIKLGVLTSVVINPGGYAIVGAAALTGAVTHTVSSSVIAFEMTGDIAYCIPVMVAVLLANATAQSLQPSVFDSIIKMKKLPFLPSIATTSSVAYRIYVEDFMVRTVKYVWYGMSYKDLECILGENKKLKIIPLVDGKESMILLGEVQRKHLHALLDANLSQQKKIPFFNEWKLAAERFLQEEILKKQEDESCIEDQMSAAFKIRNRRGTCFVPSDPNGDDISTDSDSEDTSSSESLGRQTPPIVSSDANDEEHKEKDSVLEESSSLKNTEVRTSFISIPYETIEGDIKTTVSDSERNSPTEERTGKNASFYISSEDNEGDPKVIVLDLEKDLSFEKIKMRMSSFVPPVSNKGDQRLTDFDEEESSDKSKIRKSPFLSSEANNRNDGNDHRVTVCDSEEEFSMSVNSQRRPSRFAVTKVEGHLSTFPDSQPISNFLRLPVSSQEIMTHETSSMNGGLKKNHSFNWESKKSESSNKSYATIQAGDSNVIKHKLTSLLKTRSLLRLDNKSPRSTFTGSSSSYLQTKNMMERIREQELLWEEEEKQRKVDFANVRANPAPHQLDERSSLLQVHSMFSLLDMNHSYVTSIGKLIGIVSLKELREAVEKSNSGEYPERAALGR